MDMVDQTEKFNLLCQIYEQSDDIFLICDTDSSFIYANKITSNLFGYKNVEAMLGKNAYAMRCSAVQSAEAFLKQDALVLSTQKPIELLDIHTYADDQPHVLLTKKSPIFSESKEIVGILCHCREITATAFQNLSIKIANADQAHHDNKSSLNRSYQLITEKESLSKRETECLFFLLRGKTMAQISEILFLSKRTVENHIANIKSKLGFQKKSQLIDFGINQGFLNIIPQSLLRKEISLFLD